MNVLTKTLQTDKGINYLNIALMLLSAALAFYIPFHLFLFAYAVLGPLHYLTEISWLEKRSFFVPNKWDVVLYLVISFVIFLSIFKQFEKLNTINTALMITSFVFAFFSIFIKNNIIRFILIIFLFFVLVSLKVNGIIILLLIFSVLLPTLIHVYLFTGLFILFGALKSKSFTGILSLVVFISCSVFFFVFVPPSSAAVSDEIQKLFEDFRIMNQTFLYMFQAGEYQNSNQLSDFITAHNNTIYGHPMGVAVMRFIAFAYCYHYLNWFSKTSVIKWHEVSRQRMGLIIFLWIISVVLYAWKYKIGFIVLFTLSMLHVLCEFPLNIQTIKGIGAELGKLGKSGGNKVPAAKK